MERFIRVIKARGETVVVYTKGKYEDTTAGEMMDEDIRNVMKRLCEYENTGLAPLEITWLKERDTAMEVNEIHVDEYFCPACGSENNCDQGVVEDRFCPMCGQRLKWED